MGRHSAAQPRGEAGEGWLVLMYSTLCHDAALPVVVPDPPLGSSLRFIHAQILHYPILALREAYPSTHGS